MGTRQHKEVIVNHEEEIANQLIDHYLEGIVPMDCVRVVEDFNQEPLFQLRWYNC